MSVSINGTGGITFADTSTQNTGGYTGFRNRIINGAMMIDQRNAGASVTWTGGSSTFFIADRFTVGLFGTTYSNPTITAQRVNDAPVGFTQSLKVTSSSTITPDANKLGCWIQHIVEGFNSADIAWGTASASPVTISFRVKASKMGNISVSIENASFARSYVTTVAISAANTWETKTVTIPGDTSGTWDTTNGAGLLVKFGVMSNGSWLAGAGGSWSGTRAVLSTSQTNFIAASGDYIAFTGVQLEKGSVATPFEFRPYGQELALCQRYCWNYGIFGVYDTIALANAMDGSSYVSTIPTPVPMRTVPSMTIIGTNVFANESADFALANNIDYKNSTVFMFYANKGAPPTYGVMRAGRSNTVTNLIFSAEL